jgi:hypothetical protein
MISSRIWAVATCAHQMHAHHVPYSLSSCSPGSQSGCSPRGTVSCCLTHLVNIAQAGRRGWPGDALHLILNPPRSFTLHSCFAAIKAVCRSHLAVRMSTFAHHLPAITEGLLGRRRCQVRAAGKVLSRGTNLCMQMQCSTYLGHMSHMSLASLAIPPSHLLLYVRRTIVPTLPLGAEVTAATQLSMSGRTVEKPSAFAVAACCFGARRPAISECALCAFMLLPTP